MERQVAKPSPGDKPRSAAPIEVIAIRPFPGTGAVKAFCDIRLGGVTIRGAKIIEQPGQRAWLGMPAIKTERAWLNTIELSAPLRERVTAAAIAAWQEQQAPAAPERTSAPVGAGREPWLDDSAAAIADLEGRGP